jgi:hypothetical protein
MSDDAYKAVCYLVLGAAIALVAFTAGVVLAWSAISGQP